VKYIGSLKDSRRLLERMSSAAGALSMGEALAPGVNTVAEGATGATLLVESASGVLIRSGDSGKGPSDGSGRTTATSTGEASMPIGSIRTMPRRRRGNSPR
jgi:hypothetical protein